MTKKISIGIKDFAKIREINEEEKIVRQNINIF